jgi:gluconate 2-dehydrogenase alpha chain
VTVLAAARQLPGFELRADSNVLEVTHDGRRATGVVYSDPKGTWWQPSGVVVLAAYALNNVRLLLLSSLGRPYDPGRAEGVIGRSYSFQIVTGATGFFSERTFDRTVGTQSAGYSVDDYNADNFDHSDLDFLGGAMIQCSMEGASPITGLVVPPGTPRWGAEWKAEIARWFRRALVLTAVGDCLAYPDHFLDLDPTYRDAWGLPLLRITFDWRENERRVARHAGARMAEILVAMGADRQGVVRELPEHFDTAPYQSTHNLGGATMGAEPGTSAVNSYLQMWDVENVWVVGGSAFPQCPGRGPTGTIGAVAYRAAEGISRYLDRPGPLV